MDTLPGNRVRFYLRTGGLATSCHSTNSGILPGEPAGPLASVSRPGSTLAEHFTHDAIGNQFAATWRPRDSHGDDRGRRAVKILRRLRRLPRRVVCRPPGRGGRLPRPQRRRQEHHHEAAHRLPRPQRRRSPHRRLQRRHRAARGREAPRLPPRERPPLPRHVAPRPAQVFRRSPRHVAPGKSTSGWRW